MLKKLKVLLFLVGMGTLVAGLAACSSEDTVPKEYEKKGYTVSVSYDSNGGSYLSRDGVTIMDMFNPSQYEKDGGGNVSIKLTEPTSNSRPSGSSENISLTRSGYFLAGWYKTRTLVTNENGKAVDEKGVELTEKEDGSYVYVLENGEEEAANAAYTYDGLWDFEEDRLVYSESDGVVSLTLYAGWIPYFEFEYFYEQDGEWVSLATTKFDWKTTNAENSATSDKDTIWLPEWSNGAMNYTHSYSDGNSYEFPAPINSTFAAAYTDPDRTEQIVGSLEHRGTVDFEHGVAVGRVQNIYVDYEEGVRFKISTAQQLSENGNAGGIYEISEDLDFQNGKISWPNAFSLGTFKGQMVGADGRAVVIRNVAVTHNSATSLRGGLFGSVAEGAVIKGISFENVTFDLANAGTRLRDTCFGLFAGYIEEGAEISAVAVTGGAMKIGPISLGANFNINLLATGQTSGIECGEITLAVYGTDLKNGQYNYTVGFSRDEDGNPTQPDVTVDENGAVSLTFVTTVRTAEPYYEIKINGGNQ